MFSRVHDERVFRGSEDVVLSASQTQSAFRIRRGPSHRSEALERGGPQRQMQQQQQPRQPRPQQRRHDGERDDDDEDEDDGDDEEEEEEEEDGPESDDDDEHKESDRDPMDGGADADRSDTDGGSDDDVDDADDDEQEEEAALRARGLKFPRQSPRHLATAESYLHRQRRQRHPRDQQERVGTRDGPLTRPMAAHELVMDRQQQNESVRVHSTIASRHDRRREHRPHHRMDQEPLPMELVYLPNGEIRPREDCPPGLALPPPFALLEGVHDDGTGGIASEIVGDLPARASEPTVQRSRLTRQSAQEATDAQLPRHRQRPHAVEASADITRLVRQNARQNGRTIQETTGSPRSSEGSNSDSSTTSAERARMPTRENGQQTIEKAPVEGASRMHDDSATEAKFLGPRRKKPNASQRSESVEALERQLQHEKKRVLEKMTQVLEEQGKNHALQQRIDELQTRLVDLEKMQTVQADQQDTIQRDLERKNLDQFQDMQLKLQESSNLLSAKDQAIRRLEGDLARLKASQQEVKATGSRAKDVQKINRLKEREESLAKQLEELMSRVTKFHGRVEYWKANCRQALESCTEKSEILDLVDEMWMDFPRFISNGVVDTPDNQYDSDGEENLSRTIEFLKNRLRQKEEELRLTHIKYVELKELCARQCIREADLQNFINEHRLRGNLVIRNTKVETAPASIEISPVNDAQNSKSNSARPYRSSRGRNDEEDCGYDEASDSDDQVVERPRVFVQVNRSRENEGRERQVLYEVEHVRVAPPTRYNPDNRRAQETYRRPTSQQKYIGRTPISSTGAPNSQPGNGRLDKPRKLDVTRSTRASALASRARSARQASTTSTRTSQTLNPRPWV